MSRSALPPSPDTLSTQQSVVVRLRCHPEPWSQLHHTLGEHLSGVRIRNLVRRGHNILARALPTRVIAPVGGGDVTENSWRPPSCTCMHPSANEGWHSDSTSILLELHLKWGLQRLETHFCPDEDVFPLFPVGWNADSVERRLLQRVDSPQSLTRNTRPCRLKHGRGDLGTKNCLCGSGGLSDTP